NISRDQRGHDLPEGASIALPKRRPVALSMIRKDDEVIRTRRGCGDALETTDIAVDIPQHTKRIATGDPGMMRHFVIGDVGRVDRGDTAHDVPRNGEGAELPEQAGRRGADQGINPEPSHPRSLVTHDLPYRGGQLADEIGEKEGQCASDVVEIRVEKEIR